MGINTGQIVSLARRSCTNNINILTVIFAMMAYFALSLIETEYYFQYLIWSLYSLYGIQLSLSISKLNTHVQQIDLNSSGQINSGIRIVNDNNNLVNIGQSLRDFKAFITKNIKLTIFIVVVQVVLSVMLYILMDHVMQVQINIINQMMTKADSRYRDKTNSGTQFHQTMYFTIMAQLLSSDLGTLKKINYYTYLFLLAFLLKSAVSVFITWIKYTIMGQIQKRQLYNQTIRRQRENRAQTLTQVPIIIEKQKQKQLTIWESICLTFNIFFKLQVIAAHFRINLRLFIALYLFSFLQPFYFICMGFFYQKISKSQFMVLLEQLTFVEHKIQIPINNKQKPKPNSQSVQKKDDQNQNLQLFQQKLKQQFKNQPKQYIDMRNVQKQKGLEKRQQLLQKNQQGLKQSQRNLIQKVYSDVKLEDLNNFTVNKKKFKKKSNIMKLVYRPYQNDVIRVKKFKRQTQY